MQTGGATKARLLRNDDVQQSIEEHEARSGAEHSPGGFLPMSYWLTAEDMPTFPNLPQGRVDAQGGILAEAGWNFQENEEPFYIWRINYTHVHFALERGVLGRFACGVVKRFPTTLAVFLRLNHKTSLALSNTIKLCASKNLSTCTD